MRRAELLPTGTVSHRFTRGVHAETLVYPAGLAAALRSVQDLEPALAYTAWELARLERKATAEERGSLLLLVLACLMAVRRGSTRLPLGTDEASRLDELLHSIGVADEERLAVARFADRVAAGDRDFTIIGGANDAKPMIVEEGNLYPQALHCFERILAEGVASLVLARTDLATVTDKLDAALAEVLAHPSHLAGRPVRLTDEQIECVKSCLRNRLSIVAGGPGTGKTSIVVSLLRTLVRLGVDTQAIALAAPTGKAARRLGESIERALAGISAPEAADRALLSSWPRPETLHRLLAYSPRQRERRAPGSFVLAEQVVIVDESSMIDLGLMVDLVRSLRPESSLVLLGDADQLPAVEAGTVFRDLCRLSVSSRLLQSHRMAPTDSGGRALLGGAAAIQSGAPLARNDQAGIVARDSAEAITFEGAELLRAPYGSAPSKRLLERWLTEQIRGGAEWGELQRRAGKVYRFRGGQLDSDDQRDLEALLNHYARFRILCVTRSAARATGAQPINRGLAGALQAPGEPLDPSSPLFGLGDPVIATRNDYTRGVFNGDPGLVLLVAEERSHRPRPKAVFLRDGQAAAFTLDSTLELAHAMTVHRSQGSELDQVLVVLPDTDLPLLTRELLYTALTRARRSAVLIGEESILLQGCGRSVERSSGLVGRLAAAGVPLAGEIGEKGPDTP